MAIARCPTCCGCRSTVGWCSAPRARGLGRARLYCHPVDSAEWPADPEIVERIPLRACTRRGAAIDVVCDRGREQRSQIVFTRARGRDVVFWQSARTRKQSRPEVRLPTARGHGIAELEILVDAHERYPFTFTAQKTRTVRRALGCGDYAIAQEGRIVAAVERKSARRSGIQPQQRTAALSACGACHAAPCRGGRRGSLQPDLRRAPPAPGRWWPTASPSCRSDGRASRSSTARTASSPRSGPTDISPPRTPGRCKRPPWELGRGSATLSPRGRSSLCRLRASCAPGRSRQRSGRLRSRTAQTRDPAGLARRPPRRGCARRGPKTAT